MNIKGLVSAICAFGLVAGLAAPANAALFTLKFGADSESSNDPATGAAGEVDFEFVDDGGNVKLTLTIRNTTGDTIFGAGATAGTLTGFGFDLIDGVSIIGGSFMGGTALDTEILNADFQPFGTLDFAAADNGNFNGGNANGGLATGATDTVMVLLDTALNANDAMLAFMAGFFEDGLQAGMRFQQVNAGEGSDKLVFMPPTEIPLPAAMWLMIAGVAGLRFAGRRKSA